MRLAPAEPEPDATAELTGCLLPRGALRAAPLQGREQLVAGYGFGGFLGGLGRFGAVPARVPVTVRMTVSVWRGAAVAGGGCNGYRPASFSEICWGSFGDV